MSDQQQVNEIMKMDARQLLAFCLENSNYLTDSYYRIFGDAIGDRAQQLKLDEQPRFSCPMQELKLQRDALQEQLCELMERQAHLISEIRGINNKTTTLFQLVEDVDGVSKLAESMLDPNFQIGDVLSEELELQLDLCCGTCADKARFRQLFELLCSDLKRKTKENSSLKQTLENLGQKICL